MLLPLVGTAGTLNIYKLTRLVQVLNQISVYSFQLQFRNSNSVFVNITGFFSLVTILNVFWPYKSYQLVSLKSMVMMVAVKQRDKCSDFYLLTRAPKIIIKNQERLLRPLKAFTHSWAATCHKLIACANSVCITILGPLLTQKIIPLWCFLCKIIFHLEMQSCSLKHKANGNQCAIRGVV